MVPVALEQGTVIIAVAIAAIPIAAIAFALGAGQALREIGKGQFAIDHDLQQKTGGAAAPISKEVREAEIRQMLEASSYRRVGRGEKPLDIDEELDRILAAEREQTANLAQDKELREEVRQLVVARNERRMRRGEKALDVDAEVERQLRELENLGQ